jgi:hypothetical protein
MFLVTAIPPRDEMIKVVTNNGQPIHLKPKQNVSTQTIPLKVFAMQSRWQKANDHPDPSETKRYDMDIV